ncbi:hypothetical protein KOXY103107_14300 [Komagataeibacter xylinus]
MDRHGARRMKAVPGPVFRHTFDYQEIPETMHQDANGLVPPCV